MSDETYVIGGAIILSSLAIWKYVVSRRPRLGLDPAMSGCLLVTVLPIALVLVAYFLFGGDQQREDMERALENARTPAEEAAIRKQIHDLDADRELDRLRRADQTAAERERERQKWREGLHQR